MTQKRTKPAPKGIIHQSREQRLRQSAVRVFAEKGFAGATVKEIADKANVNASLINYHYNGKEGLYRACIEHFGMGRLQLVQQILTSPKNAEDLKLKLKLWMEQMLIAHIENPEMISIINREVMTDFSLVKDIFENTFLLCFQTLLKFLEDGKEKKFIRKELDSEVAACLLFGGICHAGRTENIRAEFFSKSVKDLDYRHQLIEQMLQIIWLGVGSEY